MDLRRAPPSSPHLLPRKRQGGRCHTVWPRARSPTASTPSPSAPGRLASPGCRQAERIYLHISTFVPCRRPISARGEAGVLGGARAQAPAAAAAGSRAGSSRGGRAAHCSRSPGLPPRPRPGLKGKDKEAVPEAPPEPRLPAVSATTGSKMVCGGFACSKNCLCALNLLYTVSTLNRFLPACGLCTCSVAPWFPCLTSDSDFIPHPFPSSHALRAPDLTNTPRRRPGAGSCRSLFLSLIVKPPSFWLTGRVSATLLYPAPSPTALFFCRLTRPFHFPIPIPSDTRSWLPTPSGAGLEAGEQPQV